MAWSQRPLSAIGTWIPSHLLLLEQNTLRQTRRSSPLGVAGWAPNPSSKVVQLAKEVMRDITGLEPKVRTSAAAADPNAGDTMPGSVASARPPGVGT